MNNNSSVFTKIDPETQRKRALAKVYKLLMKLVEEKESIKSREKTVPLKSNIPVGQ